MSFTIPNEADAFNGRQAEIDKVDWDALMLGIEGNGVLIGCAVTWSSGMGYAVAAGAILHGGSVKAISSTTKTLSNGDATNPRFDLITAKVTDGTVNTTAGTAAANPVCPSLPADSVPLAIIYVPANETTGAASRVYDRRTMLQRRTGIIHKATADYDIVNTAAEQSVYQGSGESAPVIPANLLGPNGGFWARLSGDYLNNSGASRTLTVKVKFGSTTIFNTTTPTLSTSPTNRRKWVIDVFCQNTASGAQKWACWFYLTTASADALAIDNAIGQAGVGVASSSEDTTADKTFDVTFTHATNNASLSIKKTFAILSLLP